MALKMANIKNCGQYGVVKDLPATEIPLNAWSGGSNIRFHQNGVSRGSGWTQVRAASVEPYFLMSAKSPSQSFYVYLGLAKAYGWYEGAHAEITNVTADYVGTAQDFWNGGVFHGIPFFNNGIDVPQIWNPMSLTQKLVNLTNWPASTTAKVLRAFKYHMVALNVTKPALQDPRMVKWSHQAAPGTVPTSWDETDATVDASEISLSEGVDALIDCLPLGASNIIYGESSTTEMIYVGHPAIFAFRNRFRNSGILAQDCAVEFRGKHFVVTADDIVLHNGSSIESILDAKMRSWFFSNISSTFFNVTRVVPHRRNREFWVLFPYGDTDIINMALIWNWVYNTWTIRELPYIRFATPVPIELTSEGTWDADTLTWDADTEAWNSGSSAKEFLGTVMFGDVSTPALYLVDDTGQSNGVGFTAMVERKGLCPEVAFDGQLYQDANYKRLFFAVWPQIDAPNGTVFKVQVGVHDAPDETPSWNTAKTWTVGGSPQVVDPVSGRYFAVRFIQEDNTIEWELKGYGIEYAKLGRL